MPVHAIVRPALFPPARTELDGRHHLPGGGARVLPAHAAGVSRTLRPEHRTAERLVPRGGARGLLLCRAATRSKDRWGGSPDEIGSRFRRLRRGAGGDDAAAAELALAAGGGVDTRQVPRRRQGRKRATTEFFDLLARLPLLLAAYRGLERGDATRWAEGVRTMAEGMKRYARARARRGPLVSTWTTRPSCTTTAGWSPAAWARCSRSCYERRTGPEPEGGARERRRQLAPKVGEALQADEHPARLAHRRGAAAAATCPRRAFAPRPHARGPRGRRRAGGARAGAAARSPRARRARPGGRLPRHDRGAARALPALLPVAGAVGARLHPRRARRPRVPAARRPKLTRAQLWGVAARSLLVLHSRNGTRRLLARA